MFLHKINVHCICLSYLPIVDVISYDKSPTIGLIFLKQLSQCQDSFIWSRLVLVACYLLNRRTIAVHTDERVRLTNEMLNAMRIVKMYCWEKLFRGLINKTRKYVL